MTAAAALADLDALLEEQLVAVEGQALEARPGPMNHDLAQLSDFGVDPERRHSTVSTVRAIDNG